MVSCCPEGSHGIPASSYVDAKGHLETWTLDGKETETYIVGPSDAQFTVVFAQDIFSLHAGRIKGLADFLADKGYRVIAPDLHKGDSVVMSPDFMSKLKDWFVAHPHDEVVRMLDDVVKKVSGEGKKVVGVGFCWGTFIWYHAQKAGVQLTGCVCLHPSLVIEDMQGRSHSELLKA